MKKCFRVIVPVALMVLAASCAKEVGTEEVVDITRKYNLTFSEETRTELSGTGSKRSVSWNEGDEILYYTTSGQSSAASATVSVSGSDAYVQIPRGRTDEFINAVYGATQLKSSSSTADCVYISSPVKNNQSYTSFSQAHVCAAFSDDIENPNLRFHNVAAIFKFTSSQAINKVVFHGNNNEIITGGSNGDLKISYTGVAISTAAASTGETSVTVTTNGVESDFYIAVLPVEFSAGISVDCYDADNVIFVSKVTNNAINAASPGGSPKVLDLGKAEDWIASAPPTAVDLGLSVKWASFNVGATKPEEYGDYFAWGETSSKTEYKWANYTYGTSKNGPFSKYVLDPTYGTVDHKTVLDLTDDAALAAWGDDWRMPTNEEVAELINHSNCTWAWTTKNGVPGYKVTSRKAGYTANSIFLPANGMKSGSSLSDGGSVGNYWTSSISAGYPYYAISPFFDSSNKNSDNCYRYFGLGVRPVQGAVVPVSSISIPETLTLIIGASETLSATVLPEKATYKNLTWTSSDETIATIDANGKVTSVTPGTATITAYSADGRTTATCVVSSNQLTESITLNKTAVEMYVGDEPVRLTATILPETTTDKSVIWTSSKTSVAIVDDEGSITAVANGTATITATAKDGSGNTASCAVTVKTHVESVSLNKTEITMYNGKTASLTATVLPSNASNKSLTWTSSDDSIATISGSGSSVYVKGISLGKATITATSVDGEITASCNVTVKQYVQSITLDKTATKIYAGNNVLLSAEIFPENASNKYLSWISSNSSVATVSGSGASATVRGISRGTTTITATADDNSGVKASCSVTIVEKPTAIDLGLSVKWASFNLGANEPEEYGDYFAWGETEPKSDYSWLTYKWCNGSYNTITKYCQADKTDYWGGTGSPDGKTEFKDCNYEDDAARANLGGSWRMPTIAEWSELGQNCTWTLTSQNGVTGKLVTSKKNGNSIFLPSTGSQDGTRLVTGNYRGEYWSSSLIRDGAYNNYPYKAWSLMIWNLNPYWTPNSERRFGCSVRPVKE